MSLDQLSTKDLEKIVSERKEQLTALYSSAVKLGQQLGEYDGSAKKDLPLACESWRLCNFHGFDIHVTNYKYTTGVLGSTSGLCLVSPNATSTISTTVHFYYDGKYKGYINNDQDTNKIDVDDHYKKGAWENKWAGLMQNFNDSVEQFIEKRQLKTEQEQRKLKRKEAKEQQVKVDAIKRERLLSEAKALKVAA